MSGFAGVIQDGGESSSPETVDAMAGALDARGPDARAVWRGAGATLVHTLFRTTSQSLAERQPVTVGDRFHVLGDVRLDARDELVARLAGTGAAVGTASPDIELV